MDPAEMMELAKKIVGSCRPHPSEYDDLVQEVAIAIWKAEPKWDRKRGVKLDTYLWNVGRWAVRDARRKWHMNYKQCANRKERINTVPFDSRLYEGIDEWIAAPPNQLPNYSSDYSDLLNQETPRNRAIIYEHFILGLPEREIGEAYGVEESRICQIIQRFRQRCSVAAKNKYLPQPQTDTLSPKLRSCSRSQKKRSRAIVNTSFLNSVLETSPMQ